ncbi:MAG: tetratricopeptide repeat protein, partial [Ktedonobacteraceae bacterium]|nr:tetratricopeptide repeat protein [Ktedonobacteraceae bacterium]
MSPSEDQRPSQSIEQAIHSAVSLSGDAFSFNVAGDQYLYQSTSLTPWKPPLMLPPRAQSFVGREEDLYWLLQQLDDEAGKVLAICGPGGMGKTALAAEALSRMIAQEAWTTRFPDGLFYHSFYTYPSLSVAFEELAHLFGEDPSTDPRRAAVRALSRRRALLVFDGVEVLPDARPLWELDGKNMVLVLSRRQSDAPDFAHSRTLMLLSQEQSLTLLKELAGPRATDQVSAKRLVQSIGGYPLALQLIGSYLFSRQQEVAEYQQWFEQVGLRAVHRGEHQAQSVAVLLERTYDSLMTSEQRVFAVLGLLAPAPFPSELVQDILELPEWTVHQVLGSLVNLSVLRRPDQHYEVSHPLVHTFAKERLLSPEHITIWRERFLATLATHFGQSDPYDRMTLALWQPHVLSLLSDEPLTAEQSLRVADLFTAVGFYASTQGKYEQAEPLYQRALHICEQVLGPEHPSTGATLHQLGSLYQQQGKYEQAEPLYQRALRIKEQVLGAEHPSTASTLHALASLYQTQGKYEQAEPLYQRALHI